MPLTPEQAVSAIEPMATLGVAVCLAYLGLDPFRYRAKIARSASTALADIKDPSVHLQGFDHYKWLSWLAELKTVKAQGNFSLPFTAAYFDLASTLLLLLHSDQYQP